MHFQENKLALLGGAATSADRSRGARTINL
jgi:hypothetical protein